MSGNNNTITAADAIITLTVNNLYPSGVQLQGFAADNVYGTDPLVLTVNCLRDLCTVTLSRRFISCRTHPAGIFLIPGQPHPGPAGLYSVVMLSCCFRR